MIKKHVPTRLKWLSYNSQKYVSMAEIPDDHLHNIVHHLNSLYCHYDKWQYIRIMIYAYQRGINVALARKEQIPYKNKAGELVVWDYSKGMEGYPNP